MLRKLGTYITQTVFSGRTCKKFQCCCLYTGTQRFTFTCEKKKKHPFKPKPKITWNTYHKLRQSISHYKKEEEKNGNKKPSMERRERFRLRIQSFLAVIIITIDNDD